jgi:hypothetical protein
MDLFKSGNGEPQEIQERGPDGHCPGSQKRDSQGDFSFHIEAVRIEKGGF